MTRWLLDVKKFMGALAGAVAIAISSGLLSGTAERWTTTALGAATAFLVYWLRNTSADPEVPPDS